MPSQEKGKDQKTTLKVTQGGRNISGIVQGICRRGGEDLWVNRCFLRRIATVAVRLRIRQ